MDTAIITGLFSLGGIVVTSIITNSLIKYRVEQLEKKVDYHNNVINRVYKLEQKVEDIEK